MLAALLLDVRLWAAAPAAVQQNLFALCLQLAQVIVPASINFVDLRDLSCLSGAHLNQSIKQLSRVWWRDCIATRT